MSDTKEKAKARTMDKILSWSCAGIQTISQTINIPFNVSRVQCVRLSYARDDTEDGFTALQCPNLFGSETIGTFSDSKAATDSGFDQIWQSSRQISGSHTFTWADARGGTLFVHLRFFE